MSQTFPVALLCHRPREGLRRGVEVLSPWLPALGQDEEVGGAAQGPHSPCGSLPSQARPPDGRGFLRGDARCRAEWPLPRVFPEAGSAASTRSPASQGRTCPQPTTWGSLPPRLVSCPRLSCPPLLQSSSAHVQPLWPVCPLMQTASPVQGPHSSQDCVAA